MSAALELNSNSNAEIKLLGKEKNLFVKKTFKSSDLDRSFKAVLKQKNFALSFGDIKNISASRISEFSVCSKVIEIIMPYDIGISGSDYALYGDKTVAHGLAECLSDLLKIEMNTSSINRIHKDIFIKKISEICSCDEAKDFSNELKIIEEWIYDMDDLIDFPIGSCHGDLTLSNVIYSNNTIKLIDFLPTFLESPLQDVAKLDQDYIYGWSLRHASKEIKLKGNIFFKYSYPEIICDIKKTYFRQYQILMVLCIIRIIPYIKDDITRNWILVSLNNLIRKIK